MRVARRLNSAMLREGRIFAHRYHVTHLKNPTQVRNALRYVLLNRKHHDAEKRFSRTWFDPCSSAAWFDGWSAPLRFDAPWKHELANMSAPNVKATTWLLREGWRKAGGALRIDDAPS